MKIVVASTVGSAGKTTITAHMLHPRLPKAKIISVDTVNYTVGHFGIDSIEYSGDDFAKMYKDIVKFDDVIIDVGGSLEARQFLEGMDWMGGSDEIDYFIVPAKPDNKDQISAWQTIDTLLTQGVQKDRIKVIFNSVHKDTEREFDHLLGLLYSNGIDFSLDATIFAHDFFDILSKHKRSMQSILADTTDYKAKLKASTSATEEEEAGELLAAQRAAPKINTLLDKVFAATFATKKAKTATTAKA